MSVWLARKSAAKSNEKLVNQNYATLFLSWMPFSTTFPESEENKNILARVFRGR